MTQRRYGPRSFTSSQPAFYVRFEQARGDGGVPFCVIREASE